MREILCLLALFSLIGAYIYIKMSQGFWAVQPVFHVYDIGYLFHIYAYGVIQPHISTDLKYINNTNISTYRFSEMSNTTIDQLHNFISTHYLSSQINHFSPLRENISSYFIGHSLSPLISFYYSTVYKTHPSTSETLGETFQAYKQITSVITSRPVSLSLAELQSSFYAQYVDYLCVDKQKRKSGIAPQMIRTHYTNQRKMLADNIGIIDSSSVCVFKREGELTGIVPICVYTSYGYENIRMWPRPQTPLSPGVSVVRINKSSFFKIRDFIELVKHLNIFDTFIHSDYGNIMELVNTDNIYMYALMNEDIIISLYVFRKSCTFIKNDEIISCISSVHGQDISTPIFVLGFKWSLYNLLQEKSSEQFNVLEIEDISHNNIINSHVCVCVQPTLTSPTAYFFYNYARPTIPSSNAFIIL